MSLRTCNADRTRVESRCGNRVVGTVSAVQSNRGLSAVAVGGADKISVEQHGGYTVFRLAGGREDESRKSASRECLRKRFPLDRSRSSDSILAGRRGTECELPDLCFQFLGSPSGPIRIEFKTVKATSQGGSVKLTAKQVNDWCQTSTFSNKPHC